MRVVDASAWRPMPYATQLLADLGADVLKIEPPGGDPMRGFPELFADVAGGMMAALTICAAWAKRLQTGEGEYIDVAMTDVVASWVGPRSGAARRDREAPAPGSAGYGVFRCADGEYVALGVIAEDHF